MMTMMMRRGTALFTTAALVGLTGPPFRVGTTTTVAFTSGAGSCPTDRRSAAHGSHATEQRLHRAAGSLAALRVAVRVNGAIAAPPTTSTAIPTSTSGAHLALVGVPVSIALEAKGEAFRGALVKLAYADDDVDDGGAAVENIALEPSTNAALAKACEYTNAVGLSHFNSQPKIVLEGTATFFHAGTVHMDVTVVTANNATHSISGYSGFTLTVIDPSATASPSHGSVRLPAGSTTATMPPTSGESASLQLADADHQQSGVRDGNRGNVIEMMSFIETTTTVAPSGGAARLPLVVEKKESSSVGGGNTDDILDSVALVVDESASNRSSAPTGVPSSINMESAEEIRITTRPSQSPTTKPSVRTPIASSIPTNIPRVTNKPAHSKAPKTTAATTPAPVVSTFSPTATPYPTITSGPTYRGAVCNLCIDLGHQVTARDAVLVLDGLATSCGTWQDAANAGQVSPDLCAVVSQQATKLCRCQRAPQQSPASSSVTTFPPTASQYPTATTSPTYSEPCQFCAAAHLDATVHLAGLALSCREVVRAGVNGLLAPDLCAAAQQSVQRDCGCPSMPPPPPPTVAAPTATPMLQTFAPTTSAYPTATASPSHTEKCDICAGFEPPTAAAVSFLGLKVNCVELQRLGARGLLIPEACPTAMARAIEGCGCSTAVASVEDDTAPSPTSSPRPPPPPPTSSPRPPPQPTSSPLVQRKFSPASLAIRGGGGGAAAGAMVLALWSLAAATAALLY